MGTLKEPSALSQEYLLPPPLLPVWERPCRYISLPGQDLTKKEMDPRECRQCPWRSRVQPQPGRENLEPEMGRLSMFSVRLGQASRGQLCRVHC